MADSEVLTLANICLDVQIRICMFLHPTDILALRNTCKALRPSTWQRVVWVAALHRVCLDNTIFFPSFPISDMSDLELEKAAMGPRRWIELCGAFEKQHLNDPHAILRPRSIKIINDSLPTEVDYYKNTEFFFVPGGRFMVSHSRDRISVSDLGYTSSADCKLIASVGVGLEGEISWHVQTTPDGMGLIIYSQQEKSCSVYEIYPQNETPHLTQIAHLNFGPGFQTPFLAPSTVIWNEYCSDDESILRVWDYRLNHSISFIVDVDCGEHFGDDFDFEIMVTKTAVIFTFPDAIKIWAIPPLLPQPPDFSVDHYLPHLTPPLFVIPFPDDFVLLPENHCRGTISSWYSGFSQPLYFDMLRTEDQYNTQDSKSQRVQIMLNLKPDLSTASLHVNTSEVTPHDFDDAFFQDWRICEDTLFTCWQNENYYQSGIYTQLTSVRFDNVVSHAGPVVKMSPPGNRREYRLFSCPASGRYVNVNSNRTISVLDFL